MKLQYSVKNRLNIKVGIRHTVVDFCMLSRKRYVSKHNIEVCLTFMYMNFFVNLTKSKGALAHVLYMCCAVLGRFRQGQYALCPGKSPVLQNL